MKYTIVTAFYLMKSKFSPDKYKEWISNFLNLRMNCLLFTNQQTKLWLSENFDLQNIKIEILEMDQFITSKYDWQKQYEMDDEKYHTRELYMVWNEKINFLKIACDKNPYQSEWFLWCDMGSLRQKMFLDQDFKKSKTLYQLDQNKTYFFRIYYYNYHNPYFLNNLKEYECENVDLKCVQGGFILTNLNTYKTIHSEYYEILDKLYKKGLFIGKDQCCYLSLVSKSKNTKVLEITDHILSNSFKDVWFFVYPFMLGISKFNII